MNNGIGFFLIFALLAAILGGGGVLVEKYVDLKEQYSQLAAQNEELSRQIEQLKNDLDRAGQQVEEYKTRLAETETKLTEALAAQSSNQATIQQLQAQIAQYEQKITELDQTRVDLEKKLAETQANLTAQETTEPESSKVIIPVTGEDQTHAAWPMDVTVSLALLVGLVGTSGGYLAGRRPEKPRNVVQPVPNRGRPQPKDRVTVKMSREEADQYIQWRQGR